MYFQPFFSNAKSIILKFNQQNPNTWRIEWVGIYFFSGILQHSNWCSFGSIDNISNCPHHHSQYGHLLYESTKNYIASENAVECGWPFGLFYTLFRLCCGFLYDNATIYIMCTAYIPFCVPFIWLIHGFSIRFDFIFYATYNLCMLRFWINGY